jgi:2-polyprenyl-6-hydroxyphenyl methylase / 3-demethylubiquinone-9 3-methyltransferase
MTQNVDASELAKFTDVAHDWWDPTSRSFGALHTINPLRQGWINDIAPLQGKRILDVGCGGGILADSMARAAAKSDTSDADAAADADADAGSVLGIDLGAASLDIAQLHALEAQTPAIRYRCISAEALASEQPAAFDVVTCMEMLEHVPDPAAIVQACSRLVKPGGWVFFSTINRNARSFLHAIVGAEYVLGLVPRGTHEYAKFIVPADLMRWCREHQLSPQATRGLGYNLLTQRYALTNDTRVNYLIATQKTLAV